VINEIKNNAEQRMKKSLESLQSEFSRLRTGRAHPSLIEHLMIEYYGTDTPISQVASINVADSRTLLVTPWEKIMVATVEKAIINSNLGLNPATAGQAIRIPIPPLTEERRKDMIRIVRDEAENARIAVRNIRRDANNQYKKLLKAKTISEDEDRDAQDAVQKSTDKFIADIDKLLSAKEADLMEI